MFHHNSTIGSPPKYGARTIDATVDDVFTKKEEEGVTMPLTVFSMLND